MNKQEFIQLLSVLMPAILFYLKYRYDIKMSKEAAKVEAEKRDKERDEKDERRLATQTKVILENIGDLQAKLGEFENLLVPHIEDGKFLINYKDELQTVANSKLVGYRNLGDEHRKILNYWVDVIERFGIRYCYSSIRHGDKKELEIFLTSHMDIKIAEFNAVMSQNVHVPRKFHGNNIQFNTFMNGTQKEQFKNLMPLHTRTNLLILALVANGLDPEALTKLFASYIKEFFATYFDKLDIWTSLDEPEWVDIK